MTTYRGCRPNSTKMVPAGRQRVWLAAVLLALAALLSEPALSHGAGVGGSSATSTQSTAKVATTATTGVVRSFDFGPLTAEAPATCEVTISWGDGTSSPASLGPANEAGEREVTGTHLYAKAGSYEATQRATSSALPKMCWLGPHTTENISVGDFVIGTNTNYAATIFVVAVSDPTAATSTTSSGPPASSAAIAPILTGVTQSHRLWRGGRLLARLSAAHKHKPKRTTPVGSDISFSLNEQATVSFSFTQAVSGRTAKGRCVAPGKKNGKRKSCKRTLMVGALSFKAHIGTNNVLIQGRLSRVKKLGLGRYTLIIVAANDAGSSKPQSLRFTIVP